MAEISIKYKKKPPKWPDVEPAEFKISQNAHNFSFSTRNVRDSNVKSRKKWFD